MDALIVKLVTVPAPNVLQRSGGDPPPRKIVGT